MYPFKLTPAYRDYIWGGENLKKSYNKQTELSIIAESWELSARNNGSSIISEVSGSVDNALLGMPFFEFTQKFPEYLGSRVKDLDYFPILIKLIDAKSNLSVQVHPDDEFALKNENSLGKTEMWHILEAEEGAFIYIGFKRDVTPVELKELIKNNSVTSVLNKVFVRSGDTFFISAGTIHAINSGIVLAEIQQNSDLTYRVYDYGRLGADGKSRELHIEKALKVLNLKKYEHDDAYTGMIANKSSLEKRLAKCPYFTVDAVTLNGHYKYDGNDETFASVLVTDGYLEITADNGHIAAQRGDSIFFPAGKKTKPVLSGSAKFLITTY